MGWTIFTLIDLWIGIVVLDAMAPNVPPEKVGRLRTVRKVTLALVAATAIVLVVQIARHYGWIKG